MSCIAGCKRQKEQGETECGMCEKIRFDAAIEQQIEADILANNREDLSNVIILNEGKDDAKGR